MPEQEQPPLGIDPERPMDILDAACPSRDVFVDLADKWALLMLLSLRERGVQRFSELQRSIGGISRKMFSQTLRTLERDGLVSRTVDPNATPPLVHYGLTGLGTEIAEETRVLCTWTADRAAQVYAARAAYDQRTTA
ncbi:MULTISPECIES: helix-turn-helix domain-containing protein [unclassified Streptomyces]|uniref:winged helix-turn-helix transcriptional regulator n=1 Tax=unclassified Streptomyces TaxID=2593676 RepID=UPI00343E74A2